MAHSLGKIVKDCFKQIIFFGVVLVTGLTNATGTPEPRRNLQTADRPTLQHLYSEGSMTDGVDASGRISVQTGTIRSNARFGAVQTTDPGMSGVITTSTGAISIMGTLSRALLDNSPHGAFSNHNLSRFFLTSIFGGVTHALHGDQAGTGGLVALLFRIFNLGILSTSALIVIYASVFSVSTTSHDGGAVGSGRFSPFSLARVVGSIFALIPSFSGYSLIQVIVMKMVVAGVVVADLAWEASIDYVRFSGSDIFLNKTTVSQPGMANYASKLLYDTNGISNVNTTQIPARTTWVDGVPPRTVTYPLTTGDSATEGGDNAIERYLNPINASILDSIYILRRCLPVANGYMGFEVTPSFVVTRTPVRDRAGATVGDDIMVRMEVRARGQLLETIDCFKVDINYATGSSTAAEQTNTIIFVMALTDYIRGCCNDMVTQNRLVRGSLYTAPTVTDAFATRLNTFYSAIRNRSVSQNTGTSAAATTLQGFKDEGWASAGMHYFELFKVASPAAQTNTIRFKPTRIGNESQIINYRYIFNNALLKSSVLSLTDYQGTNTSPKLREQINTRYAALFVATGAPVVATDIIDWAYNNTSDVRNALGQAAFQHGTDRFNMGPDFDVDGGIIPNEIRQMSTSVAISVLDAMSVDGGSNRVGTANQYSAADKENPILLTQRLGMDILGYTVTFFRNTTTYMYNEITRAQQNAYIMTSIFSTFKGILKGVQARAHAQMQDDANMTKDQQQKVSKRRSVAEGLQNAGGMITDPIMHLIEFSVSVSKAIVGVYLPLGNGLAVVYFVAGLILGAYIPFVPTLIFLFSILAWVFSVIEAMIAAPIVMTGFAHPEGHEIIGKTEQAIMLLVGIFVRPFVTLVGFLMSMIVSVSIIKLFNETILVSTVFYFQNLMQPGINIPIAVMIGVSGLVVLYSYALMVLLQQSYSMIYLIPDQILKWVGGPAQSAGAGIASAMRSVSQGLATQSQSAAQGASGAAGKSTSIEGIN